MQATTRPAAPARPAAGPAAAGPGAGWAGLVLAALGVVYGDIGTSPLYALRESLGGVHRVPVTPANVLGVVSLVVWALVLIVSVKYLGLVMRAHNRGEGGILALVALLVPSGRARQRLQATLILLAMFAASLFYGDSVITPAISVLSAIEGLEVVTPALKPYVVPSTVAILVGLFAVQSAGTTRVGGAFGPVMLVWFLTMAVLGLAEALREPRVWTALSPHWGVQFLLDHGAAGLFVLGSVFLAVTGAEALYADMGHFGARPIRLGWYGLVFPALLLNYLGQGALLLRQPHALQSHPFFLLAPSWFQLPLVVLAAMATVIASQAVISGAFSLTRQAVQLGFLPRLRIEHTSATHIGQIYVPLVNWLLLLACVGLVLGFRTSSALAGAYGVALTTHMLVTTVVFVEVARRRRRWGWGKIGLLVLAFGWLEVAFFGANLGKVPHGGWFPLVLAAGLFTVISTWRRGRQILARKLAEQTMPLEAFLESIRSHPPLRVPGVAVFMYGSRAGTPPALLHNLKHNKVLHRTVILLTVETLEVPWVDPDVRADVVPVGEGMYQVVLRYGFKEDPCVPEDLLRLSIDGVRLHPMEVTYFLGRETILPSRNRGMALWRERLFAFLARNAQPATAFFGLPPNRVVELGAQVEI